MSSSQPVDGSEEWDKSKLDPQRVFSKEPSIFHVPLSAYPMQPWSRAVQQLRRGTPQDVAMAMTNLRQWFNYDMTPAAWEAYAKAQVEAVEALKR